MQKLIVVAIAIFLSSVSFSAFAQEGNLYLVQGTDGPGFTSPQEAAMILEKGILPTFDAIKKLQDEGKVVVSGLPIADRAMILVVKASSNAEVDQMLRSLPAWGALKWKVTAMESLAGRAKAERKILAELKKMNAK